jgi:hypothetical protein
MCYTGHHTERKAKKETRIRGRHILSLFWEIEFCRTDTGRTDCHGNGRRRTNELTRKEKRSEENFGICVISDYIKNQLEWKICIKKCKYNFLLGITLKLLNK